MLPFSALFKITAERKPMKIALRVCAAVLLFTSCFFAGCNRSSSPPPREPTPWVTTPQDENSVTLEVGINVFMQAITLQESKGAKYCEFRFKAGDGRLLMTWTRYMTYGGSMVVDFPGSGSTRIKKTAPGTFEIRKDRPARPGEIHQEPTELAFDSFYQRADTLTEKSCNELPYPFKSFYSSRSQREMEYNLRMLGDLLKTGP